MRLPFAPWKKFLALAGSLLLGVTLGISATLYLLLDANPPDLTRSVAAYRASQAESTPGRGAKPVQLSDMPKGLARAFIAIEDERFYEHGGVDVKAIARAVFATTQGKRQGAGTITMQVARNVVLADRSKSISRKLREVFVAMQLERNYTKAEILECYVNEIYFGAGAFGVQQASRTYFGKDARQLTVEESALLAGLAKAPSALSPFKNPAGALERRNVVLSQMRRLGYIESDAELEKLVKKPIRLRAAPRLNVS